MTISAVICAGGSGKRFGGDTPKQFRPINHVPLIIHTLRAFERTSKIDDIVVVFPKSDLSFLDAEACHKWGLEKVRKVVPGGTSRQASVFEGLKAISWNPEIVAIHDAARCLVSTKIIEDTLSACANWDGGIAALPVKDTLKRVKDEKIEKTIPRMHLWAMQTPQTFKFDFILNAYREAEKQELEATDDAMLAEAVGGNICVVEGSTENIKVTYREDLELAELILSRRNS